MTVTPVSGEFLAKKLDNDSLVDDTGRRVPLPDISGMSVRVRRLWADGQPDNTELPVA